MKKMAGILSVLIVAFSLNAAKTQIRILVNGYVGWLDWMKIEVPQFEKKYPDYEVKIIPAYCGGEDQYETKIAMMLGQNDSPDVVFIDSTPYLHSYIKANLLAPLPELNGWPEWKNFYQSFPGEMMRDGKYYAVPISAGDVVLLYSKKIFKEAGITLPWKPKNWNDVLNAARAIKSKVKNVYPFWCNINSAGEATSMITALMLIEGTDYPLYKDGKYNLSSKGVLDSFKFLETMTKEGLLAPVSVLLDPQAGVYMETKYAPQQKVGIFLDGAWHRAVWKDKLAPTMDYYDLAPMPTQNGQGQGFITLSGGWMLAISAKSQAREAAWKFVEFMTSKDSLLNLTLVSQNPSPRMDVAADKQYPAIWDIPTQYLQYAKFRPASPEYPAVSVELRDAVENITTLKKTPEEAMKDFSDNVERSIGKNNVIGK